MKTRKRKKQVKLMSVTQMATMLAITRQGVRESIVEGRLPYKTYKVGHNWVIEFIDGKIQR